MALTVPAPGPELARVLAETDLASLDHADQLAVVKGWEQLARWAQAQGLAAAAAVAGTKPHSDDFVVDEIGAGLGLSRGQAQMHVALARDLDGPRRETRQALAAGTISLDQARVLSHELGKLPDRQAHDVEAILLEGASAQTKRELEASARKAVTAADPELARERRASAAESRAAWIRPLGDGLTMIGLVQTDEIAAHIWSRVEALVPNGTGTKEQNRADAITSLILGAQAPTTELIIHAERHDLGPVLGEVLGSPLDPASLQKLVAGGTIRWHDPGNPPPEAPTYRPSRPLDHWIRHQDRTCQGPGCTADAWQSDVHHVHPYRHGGPTAAHNLVTLCRHCHRLVHEGHWELKLDPGRVPRWRPPARQAVSPADARSVPRPPR